jgi:hypothetical protein
MKMVFKGYINHGDFHAHDLKVGEIYKVIRNEGPFILIDIGDNITYRWFADDFADVSILRENKLERILNETTK